MDIPLDLDDMAIIRAIGATSSISAAARTLGISQQAASLRLRALETRVQLDLVARSPHGAALTAEGALVADWSGEVLDAADRLWSAVEALRPTTVTRLDVAASLTIAEALLPGWLVAVASRTGAPQIAFRAENSEAVLADVRTGAVRLGFVETPELPPDLQRRTIASDELVVVVAPDHPWAERRAIPRMTLARTSLVVREQGSGTRLTLDAALGADQAEAAAEFASNAAVRTAAADGLAPAVLSILSVRDDLALGRLVQVRVDGLRLVRPLTAVWNGTIDSGAAAMLAVISGSDRPGPAQRARPRRGD